MQKARLFGRAFLCFPLIVANGGKLKVIFISFGMREIGVFGLDMRFCWCF